MYIVYECLLYVQNVKDKINEMACIKKYRTSIQTNHSNNH